MNMNEINVKTRECIELAVRLYGERARFAPLVTTCSGRAAGWCRVRAGRVELRFNLDGSDELLNNTIPHEVAHAVTWKLYGTMKHDMAWRRICITLGGNGERCHQEALPAGRNRDQTLHIYRASCGTEINLSPIRHKRVQTGKGYTLRTTGGKITASGYVRSV